MQTEFIVRAEGHQMLVEVNPSSRELPDVPQPFTVCLYTLQPCCDKSPATETVLADVDRKIASQFEAGTFLRGKCRIIRPDKQLCERAEEEFQSATSQSEHPATARTITHSLNGSEAWAEPEGQALAAPPEEDPGTLHRSDRAPSTTGNNRPSKGKPDTDEEIAAKITKKLRCGIVKLTQDKSPALWHALAAVDAMTESPGSMKQVGDDLWDRARKTEDTAHRNRLLSSFCRIYVARNGLAAGGGDGEESKSERQNKARHDKGATVLSWIVDGLYPYLGVKALLYYWATCKVGYMLASVTRVDIQRRKPIAELVIESLRHTRINVAGHAEVLHPGIFIKYYNSSVKLSKVCEDLGLMNLARSPISVSDSTVKDYVGVPVSFPLSQLGTESPSLDGQNGWLSVDDGREGDRPSKRQKTQHIELQVELSSSPSITTNGSPCASVRPYALDPHIESGMEHQADLTRDGGIPTPDSTAGVSNGECDSDVVDLSANESLSLPVTGSGISDGDVEGDRASLIGTPALESPAPGTTLRRALPASTDETGSDHPPSQGTVMDAMNDARCAEVPAQNVVDDSNPGHIGGRHVGNLGFESQDPDSTVSVFNSEALVEANVMEVPEPAHGIVGHVAEDNGSRSPELHPNAASVSPEGIPAEGGGGPNYDFVDMDMFFQDAITSECIDFNWP